jgi:hypothetical protein
MQEIRWIGNQLLYSDCVFFECAEIGHGIALYQGLESRHFYPFEVGAILAEIKIVIEALRDTQKRQSEIFFLTDIQ